jgi:ubiquitin conjugation factor E4 B
MFENTPRDEFMAFSMILLSNSKYVKNPYLKSKLVEILFFFTLPLYRKANGDALGRIDGVLMTHPMAKLQLVSSVMHFYTGF